MAIALDLLAVASIVAWVALAASAGHASARARTHGAGRAGALNAGLLAVSLAASLLTCAAPVVPLVAAFKEVASVAPEQKAQVLERAIEDDRPAMALALLSLPVLGVGVALHLANRRRLRAASDAVERR